MAKEKDRERVSGEDPRDDLPCDWCGEVKPTTANEVWCVLEPDGHIDRVCADCMPWFAG